MTHFRDKTIACCAGLLSALLGFATPGCDTTPQAMPPAGPEARTETETGTGAAQAPEADDEATPARYRIDTVDGEPFQTERTVVVTIADGRIGGRGPVNTWSAAIGEGGQLGPVISTRMAGPREAMAEEDRLLKALDGATLRTEPGADGLELVKDDQVVITMRRQ